MPSRYYNPRLASIAGAAQGKPYVSAKPVIDEAFSKLYNVLEIKRQEKVKEQKENNAKIANIQYDLDKFYNQLANKGKYIPAKQKAGFLQEYSNQIKDIFNKSNDPNILSQEAANIKSMALMQIDLADESYQKFSKQLEPIANLIKNNEYDKDLLEGENIDVFKKLINGDWVPSGITENGFEAIKLSGSDEFIPTNELFEKYGLIKDQSKLHGKITQNMIEAAEEFEKSDYPIEAFTARINSEILSGDLDYKTALSLAGKIGLGGEDNIVLKQLATASKEDNDYKYEDYEIDENGNYQKTGKIIQGEAGLIEAVKDYYRISATNYAKQFKQNKINKDKTDPEKQNTPQNISSAGVEDINNAITSLNFNILNGKTINGRKVENTEVKNGKLIINYIASTTKEGQQIAEAEPIDLNDQNALRSLTSEYLKAIYGSDANIDQAIYLLRNKNIKTFEDYRKEQSILYPSPSIIPPHKRKS